MRIIGYVNNGRKVVSVNTLNNAHQNILTTDYYIILLRMTAVEPTWKLHTLTIIILWYQVRQFWSEYTDDIVD